MVEGMPVSAGRVPRRLAAPAVACALAAGLLTASGAAASGRIGPNQHFIGLVNGKHAGAVIYVVCAGPAGGTGPVAGGQTVAVKRVRSGGGDTGAGGGVVYARITPSSIVEMRRYGQSESIPSSTQVPCQGTGVVTFSTCPLPQPCGAGAKVDSVPVEYVNLGAAQA